MLIILLGLFWPGAAAAQPTRSGLDFLLVGAATDQQAPIRACSPEVMQRLPEQIEIPAPAGGWSGAPQAVDVFNVFSGEVMIAHGERRICGHMQDARTRDSRFRAGVGMVVVPAAGSTDPIRVAWSPPLRARWIPTVHLGAPSPLQQADTLRLLVRTSCLAIAMVLALSALMGFLGTRDHTFLVYALLCALLLIWQAVLSGLSGYPEPWLPVDEAAPWWRVALWALAAAAMLSVLWRLSGGLQRLPCSRRGVQKLVWLLALVAVLAPWLSLPLLSLVLHTVDLVFAAGCLLVLGVGVVSVVRRDYGAFDGIVAALPLLAMTLADAAGNRLLVEYRTEVIQLTVTWFLIVAAYALNRRLGRLRRQRDELRHLAETDVLTGLPNRRAGLRQLQTYVAQAQAATQPLSIGFLDIDLFKQINDHYGHDVGDEVLVAVARALVDALPNRADVVRMGGEEFLILLPGMDAAAAAQRLEQLRERVTRVAAGLRHDGLQVTASIGLAGLRAAGDDMAALLRRADDAMYSAKRGGRNRVFAAAR
ncbi:GGDEF domain-containing protein [Stenotrophomonas sp. YIM B06876]|uniref:GGDEF domain-containing protein n=1 Tax=Stenotrophomonas sp. YIM B06876 TaxID=3060211 RepID=UPI00273944A2|nr:GGDEF domain-containing protein [Stenotrophomonas sp. YIM B06876]